MKNIKKLLLIPIVAIACLFTRIDSAYAVDYPFSVTTSSISSGGTFEFYLSAQGTFYVDCGTGGTLSSDDSTANAMISGGTINKTDTTQYTFKCTYSSAGTKTIRFGGTATNYNTGTSTAAISFNTSAANAALITSISGNLSTIFPYISGNAADGAQPRFRYTFRGTNITSIPDTLFSGYTVASTHMFNQTFSGCTGLTSIPANLFFPNATSVSGAQSMFYYTFSGCTGLTSIPANLFFPNAISVSGASYMFSSTFYNCTGLTSIPENLFFPNATSVSGAQSMFMQTFYGCSGLTSIPANLFSKITSGATSMFSYTFYGCTGLTSIPANLFSKITSGATSMFSSTFNGCTGLTSIPENLFFPNATSVSGASSMFGSTFKGCTGLTSLPENLFAKVTTLPDDAGNMKMVFGYVFENCTNITGYIPFSLFSGLITNGVYPTGNTMSLSTMFTNTGLATSCPSGTKQYITGYEPEWSGKVSCGAPITCSSGKYLPAASTTCASCPSGYTCPGGTFGFIYSRDQGKNEKINIKFDGGSSTSCNYGGTFSLPSTPAPRTGYIFSGWKVKQIHKTCDIKIQNVSQQGGDFAYKKYNGSGSSNVAEYGVTASNTFAAVLGYGVVYGRAICSTTMGTENTAGSPTVSNGGKYCWCQATGFTPAGNSYTSGPQCTVTPTSSKWVYTKYYNTNSLCLTGSVSCAYECAYRAYYTSAFRTALFNSVDQ